MPKVTRLTLAYWKGEATAEDVVAALKPSQPSKPKSTEQILRETSEDYITAEPEDTWADVVRLWRMLTPQQQAELSAARQRRFG